MEPEAVKKVRGDSFVAETNIHWPTESSLIRDGLRKILALGLTLAAATGQRGWRQRAHLLAKANRLARDIDRIAAKKGPHYEQRLKPKYRALLKLSGKLTQRARKLVAAAESHGGGDAIGALQAGNGLKRCRDHTELGFQRYISLGILGRNLHVLGKLLIAREQASSEAARSR